jgi:hypothetical protein
MWSATLSSWSIRLLVSRSISLLRRPVVVFAVFVVGDLGDVLSDVCDFNDDLFIPTAVLGCGFRIGIWAIVVDKLIVRVVIPYITQVCHRNSPLPRRPLFSVLAIQISNGVVLAGTSCYCVFLFVSSLSSSSLSLPSY